MMIAAIASGWIVGLGAAIFVSTTWDSGLFFALLAMAIVGSIATVAVAAALAYRQEVKSILQTQDVNALATATSGTSPMTTTHPRPSAARDTAPWPHSPSGMRPHLRHVQRPS